MLRAAARILPDMMHSSFHRAGLGLSAAALAATLALTGCKSSDPTRADAPRQTTEPVATPEKNWSINDIFKGGPAAATKEKIAGEVWSPKPVAIQVYPGTRFVNEGDQPIMDAAFELLDDMGDSMKAPGRVRFELYEAGEGDMLGRRLYAWDVDVLTQEQQQTYYNRVIRAYNFRLGVDSMEVQKLPTVLQVSYELANGERLQTRAAMKEDW